MTNGDFASLDEVEDIESHNVHKMAKSLGLPRGVRWNMIKRTSRDNARTPMQWTDGEGAGFTSGKPWLKINGNHKTVNVAAEEAREDGVLSFWRRMIDLRKSTPELCEGTFVPVCETKSVYAYKRVTEDGELLAVFNMSKRTVPVPRSVDTGGELVVSSYGDVGSKLRPFEFRLSRIK